MAAATKTAAKQRGRPFKPGQCGNPKGRPRKTQEIIEIETLARTVAPEAIEKLAEWMRSDNARASVAACSEILDRGYGRAKQAIEHSGTVSLAGALEEARRRRDGGRDAA